MNEYVIIGQARTITEHDDPITMEEFKYDGNAHPRNVMMIRRSNGIPYPYFTTTVAELISRDMRDPFTNQPFSAITKQRAKLYLKSLETFPDYTNATLNTEEILKKWLSIHDAACTFTNEQKELICLEAHCFLQPSDLLGLFKPYEGQGSMDNRQKAVDELVAGDATARKWILRNSSIHDTTYNKAYVLTYKEDNYETPEAPKVFHELIIHHVGEGFYFGVSGFVRNGNASDPIVGYKAVYPTIIQLLESQVKM